MVADLIAVNGELVSAEGALGEPLVRPYRDDLELRGPHIGYGAHPGEPTRAVP